MSNAEYRDAIKLFNRNGLSATEITKQLSDIYDHPAPLRCTVAKWVAKFKDPISAFEGAPRSSRQPVVIADESI